MLENQYGLGESQRSAQTAQSRKRWRLAKRLTPLQLAELEEFYEAQNGPQEPFYFYDPYETVPRFSYDPTGQALGGRYIVRFQGGWDQSVALGRVDVAIELLEVA